MAQRQRCRRSARRHEADRQRLVAVAAHAAIEVGLFVGARCLGLIAPAPVVEVVWVASHLLAAELLARALLHRRR